MATYLLETNLTFDSFRHEVLPQGCLRACILAHRSMVALILHKHHCRRYVRVSDERFFSQNDWIQKTAAF